MNLLDNFCHDKLTVPVLARAVGEHLGQLEQWMLGVPPPEALIERLAAVSEHAWCWGVRQFTPGEIETWITSNPTEVVTETPWEEPPVAQHHEIDPNPPTRLEWLLKNPAVTLSCYKSIWKLRAGPGWDPIDELQTLRWHSAQEKIGGEVKAVWRWNPLEIARPRGKAPVRPLRTTILNQAIVQARRAKIISFLKNKLAAGVYQVKIQEVSNAVYNKEVKDPYLQVLRNDMTALGWNYSTSSKMWRPR